MKRRITGLYAITPVTEDADRLCSDVQAALEGGAQAIQYRFKNLAFETAVRIGQSLRALTHARDRILIINDSVEVMLAVQADGVHLGREDADPGQVRARIGANRLIGVSCYNEFDRALAARTHADYVAFGSVFASTVKPDAVRAPLDLFGRARAQGLNTVAIGGIDATNAAQVIAAGADAVAVITAVFGRPDVREAARQIASCFG
jgi:thiamine-phosphate pyrophosphorylase